jgi:hypothetical protein
MGSMSSPEKVVVARRITDPARGAGGAVPRAPDDQREKGRVITDIRAAPRPVAGRRALSPAPLSAARGAAGDSLRTGSAARGASERGAESLR